MYVDIDVDEILDNLSTSERKELYEALADEFGKSPGESYQNTNPGVAFDWDDLLYKIKAVSPLQMSLEDQEAIIKIINKY